MKRNVNRGEAWCWRCRQPIAPGEPFDLGHDDSPGAKRLGLYRGPEHRDCSRSAGGWKRHGRLDAPPPAHRRSSAPKAKALSFFDTTSKDVEPQRNSSSNGVAPQQDSP
uniref:Uncharacterized protein n=1 Tax=Mycobacterium sp. (strain MCS) TaxID=164756 RepID=A0A5Q5BPU6_MYCSS